MVLNLEKLRIKGDFLSFCDKIVALKIQAFIRPIAEYCGLDRTSSGKVLNADVNGAINILKKNKVECLDALYSRDGMNTSKRIWV